MMRLKLNGMEVDQAAFLQFSAFSTYGARKKRAVQLLNDNNIFSQCEEATDLLGMAFLILFAL